jgi:hypothetical protein
MKFLSSRTKFIYFSPRWDYFPSIYGSMLFEWRSLCWQLCKQDYFWNKPNTDLITKCEEWNWNEMFCTKHQFSKSLAESTWCLSIRSFDSVHVILSRWHFLHWVYTENLSQCSICCVTRDAKCTFLDDNNDNNNNWFESRLGEWKILSTENFT